MSKKKRTSKREPTAWILITGREGERGYKKNSGKTSIQVQVVERERHNWRERLQTSDIEQ